MGRTLIAATALLALTPGAVAEDVPDEILVAETVRGEWRADAWINVDHIDELPVIGRRECNVANEQPAFILLIRTGSGLSVDLDHAEFDTAAITSVELDDATWQYREWSWDESTYAFVDVDYPPPPPPPEPQRCSIHGGCPTAIRRTPAREVRRSAAEPWFPLATLVNEMVHARTLRFHYRDETGEALQAEMSLDGFGEVLAWCDATLWSDAARRLNAP